MCIYTHKLLAYSGTYITHNLYFTHNFNTKISVSRHTYFYLNFIVAAAINQYY